MAPRLPAQPCFARLWCACLAFFFALTGFFVATQVTAAAWARLRRLALARFLAAFLTGLQAGALATARLPEAAPAAPAAPFAPAAPAAPGVPAAPAPPWLWPCCCWGGAGGCATSKLRVAVGPRLLAGSTA